MHSDLISRTKQQHPSFADDICTALLADPYFMHFPCRHIEACTRTEGLLLIRIVFRVRDGEFTRQDEMGRHPVVSVGVVVIVTGRLSATGSALKASITLTGCPSK